MKCRHCLVIFHDNEKLSYIGNDQDKGWAISSFMCPACRRMNLFLIGGQWQSNGVNGAFTKREIKEPIRPRGSSRPPCPIEVPDELNNDYTEACLVLLDSPKASAALSRRCLQNLLRDAAKVKHSDLFNEIQEVIDKGHLPTHLVEIIDAVRNIGNFAAHPIKSKHTGEILPVEPEEAEWNLDVIEALFDFYYIQPALTAKKRAALDAKLKEAGKPAMK